MSDSKRPPLAGHNRTGDQRRSGLDTRSEKQKARLGERRSNVDRRSGKGAKAKLPGKQKGS